MLTIDPERSLLLIVDFQARLMPAIHDGAATVRKARQLLDMARLLDVPRLFTEQNPKGLGTTLPDLPVEADRVVHKVHFDACREDGFLALVPADAHVVVIGCEAHVCVLQTVLGLVAAARRTFVAQDAVGSRQPADNDAGLRRLARHGAEIVTSEMVAFEWLQSADNPRFRQALGFIK